jgi:hypothetical protein
MAKAVAKLEETPASVPAVRETGTMFALLDRIMSDPTMPMERINQAFDFYQRVAADQARKAYDAALAAAQAEFPAITKNRRVNFKAKGGGSETDYFHEDLAELVEKCGSILAKNGITRKWRTKNAPGEPITVTCILTHVDGHFEETTLCGPRDESGNKNSLQGIASTITYLERYTFKSAIGVASKHDDDGKASEPAPESIDAKQVELIKNMIKSTNSKEDKFCIYMTQIAGVPINKIEDIPATKYHPAFDALDAKMRGQI